MANRADTFDRSTSSSTLGTPSDGGAGYTLGNSSVWGINTPLGAGSTNQAARQSGTGEAVLDAASGDVTVQLTMWGGTGANNGICFRYSDHANHWRLYWQNTFVCLSKINATNETFFTTGSNLSVTSGDTIKVVCNGSSISSYKNGTLITTVTDSFGATNTKHGLFAASSTTQFDDLSITLATPPTNIVLTTPKQYTVFQRTGDTLGIGGTGTIAITGTNSDSSAHTIEASWNGGAYTTIASSVAGGATYSGSLTGQAAGIGTLTVRFADDHTQTASVLSIGVGEVFLVAGQSNSPGGTIASGGAYSATNSLVASVVLSATTVWGDLASLGNSSTGGGQGWNFVATNLMAYCQCPVAFVHVVHGGTTIDQWVPGAGAGYYTEIAGRLAAVGLTTCRAVLWWQGESDAAGGTTQASYLASITSIANQLAIDYPAAKFMPTKLQLLDTATATAPHQAAINAAIGSAWLFSNAKAGPDLGAIPCEPEDTVHLIPAAKTVAAGADWWLAINQAFFAPASGSGPVPSIGSPFIRGVL